MSYTVLSFIIAILILGIAYLSTTHNSLQASYKAKIKLLEDRIKELEDDNKA